MASDRDRLDERALLKSERFGQLMELVGRHGPKAVQGTGRVDANELQVVADMAVAYMTSGAMAARSQRAQGDMVAGAKP